MRLVLFAMSGARPKPGAMVQSGVVDLSHLIPAGETAQLTMQALLAEFDSRRSRLEEAQRNGEGEPRA